MDNVTIGILILVIFFLIISLFGNYNLNKQIELLEEDIQEQNQLLVNQNEFINKIFTSLISSKEVIDDLDNRGILRSDDEIGRFFNYMKDIQSTLEEYFSTLQSNEEKEE